MVKFDAFQVRLPLPSDSFLFLLHTFDDFCCSLIVRSREVTQEDIFGGRCEMVKVLGTCEGKWE